MKVYVLFWSLCHGHRSHLWTHPRAQYVIIQVRRSGQSRAFWGLERLNLKFDPLTHKNVKIGTLCWRSMENCSRLNSGTISRIQFKLGTGIDHPSGITWHDSKVKMAKRSRSQRHVTFRMKIANIRTTTQRVGHKMVAMATPVAYKLGR